MEAIRNNLILLWMEPILDNSSITQIIMNIQLTLWWTQTTYLCLLYSINTLGQNQVEGYLCPKLSNKKWCYLWLWIYCIFFDSPNSLLPHRTRNWLFLFPNQCLFAPCQELLRTNTCVLIATLFPTIPIHYSIHTFHTIMRMN